METVPQNQTPNGGDESHRRSKEANRGERKLQRRKIALACEPCRERKSRCDGKKPICGSCNRRSFTLEQCVYKADNARSASNDAYIKVLHTRIRELEQACAKSGSVIPGLSSELARPGSELQQNGAGGSRDTGKSLNPAEDKLAGNSVQISEPISTISIEGITGSRNQDGPAIMGPSTSGTAHRLPIVQGSDVIMADSSETNTAPRGTGPDFRNQAQPQPHSYAAQNIQLLSPGDGFRDDYPPRPLPDDPDSLSSPNAQGPVTAMGAMSAVIEEGKQRSPGKDYFGSSSAASFMRLARDPAPNLPRLHENAVEGSRLGNGMANYHSAEPSWRDFCKPSPQFQYEHFSLPPRPLADHLLKCFFNRVYLLYPFFHRPSFEAAYEDLWAPSNQTENFLPTVNIGLGSRQDSGKYSRVFHCALNSVFALSCYFSDIPAADREAVAYSFFLRSEQLLGLELLDISTIGVVQTALILALYLQSTPYPNRCWNAIGAACRVAQGLGLHTEAGQDGVEPLETQIRRRTWHGCVMMDLVVSMTLGRPSMNSHLPSVPLPSTIDDHSLVKSTVSDQEWGNTPTHMVFYVYTVKLYRILDDIMSDVYMAWRNGTGRNAAVTERKPKQPGLDVIIDIDSKLCAYESDLPAFLSWTEGIPVIDGLGEMERTMRTIPTKDCTDPNKPPQEATNRPANPQGEAPPTPNSNINPVSGTGGSLRGQADPFQPDMGWQGASSFMDWDGADEFGFFGPFDLPDPSSLFPDMPG
ncbi:hypothetical protein FQN54_004830 [Arachnomyces sp. PD_36]|nr:hypothetical protein FQN54_004830 [Arachnomyces sp. PD_36]